MFNVHNIPHKASGAVEARRKSAASVPDGANFKSLLLSRNSPKSAEAQAAYLDVACARDCIALAERKRETWEESDNYFLSGKYIMVKYAAVSAKLTTLDGLALD